MSEAIAQSTATATPLAVKQRAAEGLWRDAFRRLRRTKLAYASGIMLLALIIVAIFAPVVSPKPYDLQNYDALTQEPGSDFWLGTDDLGRDVLSRLIYGARISLAVGFVVQAVILLIGVPAGLAAGYYGGKIDTAIMRTVDTLYSIPSLLFIIVIMTFLRAQFASADGGIVGALSSLDDRTGGLLGVFI